MVLLRVLQNGVGVTTESATMAFGISVLMRLRCGAVRNHRRNRPTIDGMVTVGLTVDQKKFTIDGTSHLLSLTMRFEVNIKEDVKLIMTIEYPGAMIALCSLRRA